MTGFLRNCRPSYPEKVPAKVVVMRFMMSCNKGRLCLVSLVRPRLNHWPRMENTMKDSVHFFRKSRLGIWTTSGALFTHCQTHSAFIGNWIFKTTLIHMWNSRSFERWYPHLFAHKKRGTVLKMVGCHETSQYVTASVSKLLQMFFCSCFFSQRGFSGKTNICCSWQRWHRCLCICFEIFFRLHLYNRSRDWKKKRRRVNVCRFPPVQWFSDIPPRQLPVHRQCGFIFTRIVLFNMIFMPLRLKVYVVCKDMISIRGCVLLFNETAYLFYLSVNNRSATCVNQFQPSVIE